MSININVVIMDMVVYLSIDFVCCESIGALLIYRTVLWEIDDYFLQNMLKC